MEATAIVEVIRHMSESRPGNTFEQFTLYECDGAYLLRSRRSGWLYRVVWSLETEWGVYITPEGNLTGLHYFPDEIEQVARLPGE